jgi:hypothetical protein
LRHGVAVFAQRPTDLFHGESSHDALITSGLPKKAATLFAKDLGASFDVSAEGPIEPRGVTLEIHHLPKSGLKLDSLMNS